MEASIKQNEQPPSGSKPLKFDTLYSQNTWSQFVKCLWKQNILYWRNPSYNAIRILFTVVSALLLGTIFWKIGSKRYACFKISFLKEKYLTNKNKEKSIDNNHFIGCSTGKQLNKC